MSSAAHVNSKVFDKLFALKLCYFVEKLFFVAFWALFSAILWLKIDFVANNRVR